jgi:hypothetical protein
MQRTATYLLLVSLGNIPSIFHLSVEKSAHASYASLKERFQ